ncbi:hypothetical protein Tco_0694849 [Tanacetum coccineum]
MSEVKKTDHSADVLASIKSQVPTLLIADEDAMDNGKFAVKVSKVKKTRLPLLGQLNSSERDDQSQNPRESDASASKTSDLTSTGWQITDTRDDVVNSSMPISDTESEHSEQSSDDIPMQDEGHVSEWRTLITLTSPNGVEQFVSKPLVTDFGLEELVPLLWVESEREYDISAVYGITHWWFRRKEFYINKHSEPSDREAVRSQMRILSVISVKVFEKYGYNYLREIILRRADYQEYKISEKDFKNLHPNDFEDLFLLNIQEKLNHLPKTDKTSLYTAVNMWIRNLVIRNRVGDLQLEIESYQTKINLKRPNWDAADYYFKEDYTIVPKPRSVVYRDRNDQRKLMRLNRSYTI